MNARHPHEASCPSRLRFDRLIAGELEPAVAAELERHAASCTRCNAWLSSVRRDHARFAAQPLPATVIEQVQRVHARRRTPRRIAIARSLAPLLAAAALVLAWVAWPVQPHEADQGVRSKGSGQLSFFVLHDGAVRPGSDGEHVQPGDRLEFAYSSSRDAYLLIVSIDAARKASVYFADAGRAAAVPAASRALLERSTELDATLGPETVYTLLCAQPIAADPVLRALAAEPSAPLSVAGCTVERHLLLKVAR